MALSRPAAALQRRKTSVSRKRLKSGKLRRLKTADLKASPPRRRTRPIPKVSKRQRRKLRGWAAVVAAKLAAAGDQCRAEVEGLCTHTATDGHHIKSRRRGGMNTRANCLLVCRACHDWIGRNVTEATRRGLLDPSWVADRVDPASTPAEIGEVVL